MRENQKRQMDEELRGIKQALEGCLRSVEKLERDIEKHMQEDDDEDTD